MKVTRYIVSNMSQLHSNLSVVFSFDTVYKTKSVTMLYEFTSNVLEKLIIKFPSKLFFEIFLFKEIQRRNDLVYNMPGNTEN